jgi:hypothetical protein
MNSPTLGVEQHDEESILLREWTWCEVSTISTMIQVLASELEDHQPSPLQIERMQLKEAPPVLCRICSSRRN